MKKIIPLLLLVAAITFSLTKFESGERHFHFRYSVTAENLADSGKRLEIWLPVPQSHAYQKITRLEVKSSLPYTIYTEPEYGNRILFASTDDAPDRFQIELSFDVTRRAVEKAYRSGRASRDEENIQRFLHADRLVPIDGEIAEISAQVTQGIEDELAKARALYDYVAKTLQYDKSGTGWGRGDALFACDARRGNCTDFHSLFIGLSRAAGIPARFLIGFPVPANQSEGEIGGYHCWAEFYLKDKGWIPVDISEAHKHPQKHEFFFGGLDANRVDFSLGRDIRLTPESEHRLNYLIYPYVLVDGQEFKDVETRFFFSADDLYSNLSAQ